MNTIMFSELRVFDASSGALRQPPRVLGEVYGARTATRKMMAALMQFVYESTTLEKLLLCSCPMAFMGSEDIDDGDWEFQDGGVGALWSGLAPSGLAESYPTLSLVRALAANTSLLELDLSCCQADAAAGRELGATVARHQTVAIGRARWHATAPQTGGDDRHAARPRPRRRRLLEPSPRLDVQGKRWDGVEERSKSNESSHR